MGFLSKNFSEGVQIIRILLYENIKFINSIIPAYNLEAEYIIQFTSGEMAILPSSKSHEEFIDTLTFTFFLSNNNHA